METIGSSPKKIAATITALVVPYAIGLLAKTFGWELDVGATTAIVGPIVLAAIVYVSAHFAKPGLIAAPEGWPDPNAGPNPPVKLNPDAGVHVPPKRSHKKKPTTRKKAA